MKQAALRLNHLAVTQDIPAGKLDEAYEKLVLSRRMLLSVDTKQHQQEAPAMSLHVQVHPPIPSAPYFLFTNCLTVTGSHDIQQNREWDSNNNSFAVGNILPIVSTNLAIVTHVLAITIYNDNPELLHQAITLYSKYGKNRIFMHNNQAFACQTLGQRTATFKCIRILAKMLNHSMHQHHNPAPIQQLIVNLRLLTSSYRIAAAA